MAYGKRKRSYRRKAYRRKRKNSRFAKKVKSIARSVIKRQPEVKVFRTSGIETAISTLNQGTVWGQLGHNIAQGTTSYTRIGDKIKIIGIQVKMYLHNNSAVPTWIRTCMVRVQDKGLLTNTSAIFTGTATNSQTDFTSETGMRCIMRPFHHNLIDKVYKDKVFKIQPNDAANTGTIKACTLFKKFPRGLTMAFNSSGTGATNVEPNIQWGIWAAEAPEDVGAGNTIEVSFQTSVWYTDA